MLSTVNLKFKRHSYQKSTLKIHNTKHNSQPANTDNPKLLLTIHNLPDYWDGGAVPSYSSAVDSRPMR